MRGGIIFHEGDIRVGGASAGARHIQHRNRNIDTRRRAIGANLFAQPECGGAATATDIEHALVHLRVCEPYRGIGDLGEAAVDRILISREAFAARAVPEFDLCRIVAHFCAFRLRIAKVRRRSALSLMKPCASF